MFLKDNNNLKSNKFSLILRPLSLKNIISIWHVCIFRQNKNLLSEKDYQKKKIFFRKYIFILFTD